MATIEEVLMDVITRLATVERELDDLRAQAGETTSVDVAAAFPSDPYDNQLVLLADGSGGLQAGTFYRYDESVGDWIQVTT